MLALCVFVCFLLFVAFRSGVAAYSPTTGGYHRSFESWPGTEKPGRSRLPACVVLSCNSLWLDNLRLS